ncbi:HAD family hydrolase [Vibrio nitrifigilis]|uniref:HAD family hydrolase n=1 Tax=Vibrio nitrifigilis TaxID=2789781 RepID=A0ABS0GK58_9VIBR|nr:HAD family hydrolase [Vibrio nitrifigilis]MBF9002866.1 HAD family hydrolase [Vibrio nitrifigilis]
MSHIKAIYFDLDNTLVHRNASIDRFSEGFVQRYVSLLSHVSCEQVANLIKTIDNGGYLGDKRRYRKISQAIGAELSTKLCWQQPIAADQLERDWKTHFPQSTVEMPSATKVLNELAKKGYYLAIISNGGQQSRINTLAATSFSPLIHHLVSSEQFGAKKPDPAIFLETISQAGFRPNECVYVGHHPVNDMQGAYNAGMHAVWLAGFHERAGLPTPAYVIQSLPELLGLVI